MPIAFIITKTPQEEGFNSFIKLLNLYVEHEDIHLYLIGNGVYSATHNHVHTDIISHLAQKHHVMASERDLISRGLESKHMIQGVKTFRDYDDFVMDIMEKMDQVLSF